MNKQSNVLEKILNHLNTAKRAFLFSAYADEGDESQNQQATPNIAQLVEQARKEEKSKLYPQIEKLKAQLEVIQKQSNEALLSKSALLKENEDLKKKLSDGANEEVTKLKAQVEALTAENKKLKEETPKEEDIRKKIEAEYEVKLYAKDKLAENKDKFLSVFAEKIGGKTKEEVDESIKKAIESSDAIRKELGIEDDGKDESKDKKKDKSSNDKKKEKEKQDKKKEPPATNPSSSFGGSENIDADEVAQMDVASKEYADLRKKLGLT